MLRHLDGRRDELRDLLRVQARDRAEGLPGRCGAQRDDVGAGGLEGVEDAAEIVVEAVERRSGGDQLTVEARKQLKKAAKKIRATA